MSKAHVTRDNIGAASWEISVQSAMKEYLNLRPPCAGVPEPRRLKLKQLKSTFCATNFICGLSWSICSNFDAIHCRNMHRSLKLRKKH